jgi:hypothetical protein
VVQALLAIGGLTSLAFAAFPVIFIVFVSDELGGDGTDIGVIRGMSAFGGIIAALVIGRRASRYDAAGLMVVGYAAFFVIGLGFVNAPPFTDALWIYLILFGLTGFPNITSQVGHRSAMQLLCPKDVLGRLSGLDAAIGAIGAGIGAGGVALLIDHVPVRVLFNAQTACMAVSALIGYFLVLRPTRRVPSESTDLASHAT